jgi:hypothetical protein
MMSAFVTEAIDDSISLPVKLLLKTTYDHAERKTLTLAYAPRQIRRPHQKLVDRLRRAGPRGSPAPPATGRDA